jgi:hypothetical protein
LSMRTCLMNLASFMTPNHSGLRHRLDPARGHMEFTAPPYGRFCLLFMG